jgi:predicted enzyme related to lactoylglutathione lyase
MTRNAINWFEIPVTDMDRAQRFYETLLARSLRREQAGPQTLAIFPYEVGTGVGGMLKLDAAAAAPATGATLVYLDASPSLDAVLSRAGELGARIVQPRTELPNGNGFTAHLLDTEGNRIGLHSTQA